MLSRSVTIQFTLWHQNTSLCLCSAALLFVASAPSRVRESLHLGKHCQQRLSPRNHHSVRWADDWIWTRNCCSCWRSSIVATVLEILLSCLLHSGVVGPELTSNNVSIFITSDAGNTWREVQCVNCWVDPCTIQCFCNNRFLFCRLLCWTS